MRRRDRNVLAPDLPLALPPTADDEADAAQPAVPAYLTDTYAWAYMRPAALRLLDRPLVVSAILWGNYRRLLHEVLAELRPGLRVYQPACVYGDFSPQIVRLLGPHGHLAVADILPIQIENSRRKLNAAANASVHLQDAGERCSTTYEVVCCFFLLHEMPSTHRRRTVDALLEAVEPGGKAVFVDYHRPHWAHPLKSVMSVVFNMLEPFAKDLWFNEIVSYSSRSQEFVWSKRIFFGGLYQKVVAQRRSRA
jgi:SAM-dependent methyltransferase